MAKKKQGSKQRQNKYHSQAEAKRARIEELKKQYQQRVNSISEQDLNYGIEQIDILFSEANKRIELIKSQGLTSYALSRVESEGGRDYFDTDIITDKQTLMQELYRVRVFLASEGSTLEGAKLDTSQISAEQYKGKFGNQYNTEEHGYKRFDTSVIDENIAERAFRTYRELESSYATKITEKGGYGSENLIIAIYDAEVRGLDSLVYGRDLMEIFLNKDRKMWEDGVGDTSQINSISGQVYDNISSRIGFSDNTRGKRVF